MSDLRMRCIGHVNASYGERVEVGVLWDEGADPAEDAEAVIVIGGGGGIELGQESAEEFARLFVSACWEAARIRPGGAA